MSVDTCDVAVVGAGPTGLSAAIALTRRGVKNVIVFERSAQAGGIPRHCGHPPFGMREFGRILTGPAYARRLAEAAAAAGVTIMTNHTVMHVGADGLLTVAATDGVRVIRATRILIATGARETTRAQQLVSGTRPLGVMNTAALQAFIYQEGRVPFRRPIIVGSELVALSAVLTCKSHGIRPVAMVETRPVIQARPLFFALPRLLGIPVLAGAEILAIEGLPRVSGLNVRKRDGTEAVLACDGVIFSGRFTPEAALAEACGLLFDPATGGPAIDQDGRSSVPSIFAAGNMVHPIETAGHCWSEGRRIGHAIAADIHSSARTVALAPTGPSPTRPSPQRHIKMGPGLTYVVPQHLTPTSDGEARCLNIRASGAVRGRLVLSDGRGRPLRTIQIDAMPQQPIRFPLKGLDLAANNGDDLQLRLEPRP
jgi:thioredoxin reductase